MDYCTACGTAFGENQLFCRECGTKKNVKTAGAKPVAQQPTAESIELAKQAEQQRLEELQRRKEQRLEKIQTAKARLTSVFTKIRGRFKTKPKSSFAILGIGSFAFLYIISFFIIMSSSGPQQTLEKYLTAVNSKSVTDLQDENLFPNPENKPLLPENLFAMYSDENGTLGVVDWSPFSDQAQATIRFANGAGGTAVVSLEGEGRWDFGFFSRTWTIASPAPTVSFPASPLDPNQGFSFGSLSFNGAHDPKIKALIGNTYIALPGSVQISAYKFGFTSENNTWATIGSRSNVEVYPQAGDLTFPDSLASSASSKANATATWCANSKCSLLPYFSDSDFSWDSDPSWDTFYDDSWTASAYSAGTCTNETSVAISPTRGYATFSCPIYAARTVTKVVYYYFLDDDYSYYSGSTSGTMSLKVNYRFNPSSKTYTVTSVTN